MVTDHQVRRLRRLDLEGLPRGRAAVKAGMDDKTARKYRRLGRLPSEVRMEHHWRTKPDPFADVWPQLEALLAVNPGLEAKTLLEYLQRQHPGRFADGQVRTLQRRVKQWRALHGPARKSSSPRFTSRGGCAPAISPTAARWASPSRACPSRT
jgi:hypothetical protein